MFSAINAFRVRGIGVRRTLLILNAIGALATIALFCMIVFFILKAIFSDSRKHQAGQIWYSCKGELCHVVEIVKIENRKLSYKTLSEKGELTKVGRLQDISNYKLKR